jgi:hypothetical protein
MREQVNIMTLKRYLALAGIVVVVLLSWRFPALAIALAVLLSLLIAEKEITAQRPGAVVV